MWRRSQPFCFPPVVKARQGPAGRGNTASPLDGIAAGEQRRDQRAVAAANLIRCRTERGYD